MVGYLAESPAEHYWVSALAALTCISHETISDSLQRFGLPGIVGLGNGQVKPAGMRSGVLQK